MDNKKSIRVFNDREVRTVWDDEQGKWYFSRPPASLLTYARAIEENVHQCLEL